MQNTPTTNDKKGNGELSVIGMLRLTYELLRCEIADNNRLRKKLAAITRLAKEGV